MDCPLESGHDPAEAYVTGTLSEAEQDAYEQHFSVCAACLARVRMLQEIKDGVRRVPRAVDRQRPPTPSIAAAPWLRLALAAAVIAAAGWWWRDASGLRSTSPAAEAGAGEPIEAPARHAVLARLATVTPPHYVPTTGRGEAPAPGSFDAAMADYVAGRHAAAATTLQGLSEAKPTDPAIAFFWGISALVTGRTDDAREGLTRAIAADVQPYEDEAHFYLAKVYLAEGALDLARLELEYAKAHQAGPDGEAQRLLTALDSLPP